MMPSLLPHLRQFNFFSAIGTKGLLHLRMFQMPKQIAAYSKWHHPQQFLFTVMQVTVKTEKAGNEKWVSLPPQTLVPLGSGHPQ